MSYRKDAISDAAEVVRNFADEILEQLIKKGKASSDLYDYPGGDMWFHEQYVDRKYNLQEAANLLHELSDYEERDRGLWEGLAPRDAIIAQAAYTYGNAVYAEWYDLIKRINHKASDIIADYDEKSTERRGGYYCGT